MDAGSMHHDARRNLYVTGFDASGNSGVMQTPDLGPRARSPDRRQSLQGDVSHPGGLKTSATSCN